MLLNRLKVSSRIYLGFGVLLALGMGIAAFGTYQFSGIARQVATMGAATANMQRVLETTEALEKVRRTQLRYDVDGEPAAREEWLSNEALVRSLMTEAGKAATSEDRRQLYAGVVDGLQTYDGTVVTYLQHTKTATDARTRLFAAGDVLTAAITGLVDAARATHDEAQRTAADAIERTILLVRIANWRFIATGDPKGVAAFHTSAGNATAAVSVLERSANPAVNALIAPVRASLAAYVTDFAAF